MTKQLCLLRHAEAGAQQHRQGDAARELTTIGEKQAREAGSTIRAQRIPIDAIFCSTAIRARQTMMIAANEIPLKVKTFYSGELYEASLDSLFTFLRACDESLNSVMVVGHNPTLSQLAEALTRTPLGLTPASLVLINLHIAHWSELASGRGKLTLHHSPGIEKSAAS